MDRLLWQSNDLLLHPQEMVFGVRDQVPAAENLLINQFKQILQLGLGPALHLLTQVFF